MIEMNGSDKQIAWALRIRNVVTESLKALADACAEDISGAREDDDEREQAFIVKRRSRLDACQKMMGIIEKMNDAKFWIENENQLYRASQNNPESFLTFMEY